jgi:hypothetical protein
MDFTNIKHIRIEQFIASVMALYGFKKKDYHVSHGQLFIRKDPMRGKIIHTLKYYYPQYSFYWDTPKILKWF